MASITVPDFPEKLLHQAKAAMRRRGQTSREQSVDVLRVQAEFLGSGDALLGTARLAILLDEVVRAEVAYRRDMDVSWSEIGASLGISKQAAQQRFGVNES